MTDITLLNHTGADMLSVIPAFLDGYLPSAPGNFIKIYLYLLRLLHAGSSCNLSSLSDTLDLTGKEILRALSYWEQCGLLELSLGPDNEIKTVSFLPFAVPTVHSLSTNDTDGRSSEPSDTLHSAQPEAVPDNCVQMTSPAEGTKRTPLSQEDIISLDNDPEYAMYLLSWQSYFPHPFTYTDTELIGYWYLQFDRNADIIDALIDYCASSGHANTPYMNAVAKEWRRKGYRTAQEAKEGESQLTKTAYAAMKVFGLRRDPAPVEFDTVRRWVDEYGFSQEMILLACQKTIEGASKPSFRYAEAILKSWKDSSITTPEAAVDWDVTRKKAIEAEEKMHKENRHPKKVSTFGDFPQRDIDYDKLLLGRN